MLCIHTHTYTHTHTHTREINGFTDLGKVDEEIANVGKEPLALEDSIATHNNYANIYSEGKFKM